MSAYALLARETEGFGDVGIITPCEDSYVVQVLGEEVPWPEASTTRKSRDSRSPKAVDKDNVETIRCVSTAVLHNVNTDVVRVCKISGPGGSVLASCKATNDATYNRSPIPEHVALLDTASTLSKKQELAFRS